MLLHRRAAQLARGLVRHTQSHGRPSARRAEVTRRTGALAVKVGMVGAWDESGRRHALTALHVDHCRVVQVKTEAKERYTALQLGAGLKRAARATAAARGHSGADGAVPRLLAEFRVSPDAVLERGVAIGADHFVAGQKVDVRGVTKGKGFQGNCLYCGVWGHRLNGCRKKTADMEKGKGKSKWKGKGKVDIINRHG